MSALDYINLFFAGMCFGNALEAFQKRYTTWLLVHLGAMCLCIGTTFIPGPRSLLCSDLAGKSARYIEGRCYVASPDGSLVPAKGER